MDSSHPSRTAIKPATSTSGTCTDAPPSDCSPEPSGDKIISTFISRTAEDDAPAEPRVDHSEAFRHGHWAPFRKRVEQALRDTPGVSPRRVAAFTTCGSDAYVECRRHVANVGAPGGAVCFGNEYRIRQTKCHDRFCVPCSQERSNRIRHSLLTHMKPLFDLKLITLTQLNKSCTLTEALDKITRCFRLLRNKPLWRKKITGGVWIIETKIGKNSGEWHCHVHCVAAGKFVNKFELSSLWEKITGDSKVVDVRPVGAKTGAVQYITKYVTKAADHQIVMDPVRLREAILAFTGRRMVSTFGTWRGLELMEKPEHEADTFIDPATGKFFETPQWRPLGSLDAIISAAQGGDAACQLILSKLKRTPRTAPPCQV